MSSTNRLLQYQKSSNKTTEEGAAIAQMGQRARAAATQRAPPEKRGVYSRRNACGNSDGNMFLQSRQSCATRGSPRWRVGTSGPHRYIMCMMQGGHVTSKRLRH